MNDKCFLDTNILVYLFDKSEPDKRRKAKSLFAELQKKKDFMSEGLTFLDNQGLLSSLHPILVVFYKLHGRASLFT